MRERAFQISNFNSHTRYTHSPRTPKPRTDNLQNTKSLWKISHSYPYRKSITHVRIKEHPREKHYITTWNIEIRWIFSFLRINLLKEKNQPFFAPVPRIHPYAYPKGKRKTSLLPCDGTFDEERRKKETFYPPIMDYTLFVQDIPFRKPNHP